MGWTVFNQMPKGGMQAAVLESISCFGDRDIVASAMVGNVVYAAVRLRGGNKVSGVVGVIEGFGYKLMAEEEGPYYYGAPAEVLEKLSPTDDPWCLKWRAKCADGRL